MPARRRSNRRRARVPRRARRARKLNVPRGITATQNQFCKVTETIAIQNLVPGVQPPAAFNLMMFSRARYMAVGFQHYKAAKCTWSYEPFFNTFQDDTVTPNNDTIPYLYSSMNRTGDGLCPNNLAAMQAMGAKPVKFLRKHLISYRPNWNTPGNEVKVTDGAVTPTITTYSLGQQACYNWIDSTASSSRNNVGLPTQDTTANLFPTNDNGNIPTYVSLPSGTASSQRSLSFCVIYNGHDVIFEQTQQSQSGQAIGKLTLTVEWHFKTPLWASNISQGLN